MVEDPFIKLKESIERSRKEREVALRRLDKLESDVQKFKRMIGITSFDIKKTKNNSEYIK